MTVPVVLTNQDRVVFPEVKTTGGKGLHVVAPLDATATYDGVHALCHDLGARLASTHPHLVTHEFYKKDRKGRVYFDTGRNTPGATFVAPYSLRGRADAPVSAPVTWKELEDDTVRGDSITLRDVAERLERVGDPWSALRAG